MTEHLYNYLPRVRGACLPTLLGIWLVGPDPCPADQFVEISATIDLLSFHANGEAAGLEPKRRSYSIKCVVGTNTWRIDSDFVPHATESWYWDGTNIYRRLQSTEAGLVLTNGSLGLPASQFNDHRFPPPPTLSVYASSDGIPLGHLGVNIPWLAFCSGGYLKRSDQIPLPTTVIRGDPHAFAHSSTVEAFGDALGLPRRVVLRTSKARYLDSLGNPAFQRHEWILNRTAGGYSIPDDQVSFHYSVEAITNVGGWTFPARFEYTAYKVHARGEPRRFVGGAGRIHGIRYSSRPSGVLVSDGVQTVVDHRFRHESRVVDGIIYEATNLHELHRVDDPVLVASYAMLVDRAAATPAQRQELARRVVLLALCGLTGGPLIVWVYNRAVRTTKQQKEIR